MDSVDFVAENGKPSFLRIAVHCPAGESNAYEDFLTRIAAGAALLLETSPPDILDGCPDLVVKTTPEFVADTALSLAKHPGAKCVALSACGVVHVFLQDSGAIGEIIRPIESALHAMGGHWQSRHVSHSPSPLEASWISTLRKEWNIS